MLLPVTKRWDLMLGVDIHLNEWGIPTAHIVGATLNWVNNDRFSPDVFANNQPVAYFLHDIKMLIPHIPLGSNMLVPIIMLLSHSRILLAAHLVRVNFRAIGVGPWPMLNCNIVFPLPTGFLIQFTNVFADIKLLDILLALALIIFAIMPIWLRILLIVILLAVVINEIKAIVEEAQEAIQQAIEDAKVAIEEAIDEIQDKLEELKDKLPSKPSLPSFPKPSRPDRDPRDPREPRERPWDDWEIPTDAIGGWLTDGLTDGNPMGRRIVQSIVSQAIVRNAIASRFPEGRLPRNLRIPGGLLHKESMSSPFAEKWESLDWRLGPLTPRMRGLEEVVPKMLEDNKQVIGTMLSRVIEEMMADQDGEERRAAIARDEAQALLGGIADSMDIGKVLDDQPEDVASELAAIKSELSQAVADELKARPEALTAGFEPLARDDADSIIPRPHESEEDRAADQKLRDFATLKEELSDVLSGEAADGGASIREEAAAARDREGALGEEPELVDLTERLPGAEDDAKWDGEDLWDHLDDEELKTADKDAEANAFARSAAQDSFAAAQAETGHVLAQGSSKEEIEAVMDVYLQKVAAAAYAQTKRDAMAGGTSTLGAHFGSGTAQQVRLEAELRGTEQSAMRETSKAMMPTAVRMVDGYLNPKKSPPVGTPVTDDDFKPPTR